MVKLENLRIFTFSFTLFGRVSFNFLFFSKLRKDVLMTSSSYKSLADLNAMTTSSTPFDAPNPTIIASGLRPDLIKEIGIGS